MRGFLVMFAGLLLTGCFMNPDPFAPERQQSLAGQQRALTPEQQRLDDWERQQAELEQQRRIEDQQRTEEVRRDQEQQASADPSPADATEAAVETTVSGTVQETTRGVRRLTPQIRTTPRPNLGMPGGGVAAPTVLRPLPGGRR